MQSGRPSLYDLEAELKGIQAPVLLLVGDEDEPCLDVNLWMKRLMPSARLALLPGAGHAINLEEPALFNQLTEQFIVEVERGTWRPRDARALVARPRHVAPGGTSSVRERISVTQTFVVQRMSAGQGGESQVAWIFPVADSPATTGSAP